MDTDPAARQMFALNAKQRREALGLSAGDVARRMSDELGTTVKHQSIYQWEAGTNAPREYRKLVAYDNALEADGELAALLTVGLSERISQLEAQMQEVLDLVRRLPDT